MIIVIASIASIVAYATIARMVYSWHVETEQPDHIHNEYCDHFESCMISCGFPIAIIWFVMLKYPFRLADHIGKYLGNRQLKRANVLLQKQLAIRQELQEANEQLRIELAKDPLTEQFDELDRQEKYMQSHYRSEE